MRLTGAILLAVVAVAAAGCHSEVEQRAVAMTGGGDPARGRLLIDHYGCGSCHTIPGARGASGLVGPPLGGIANRVYLAGRLRNTPENLMLWIRDPQRVDPRTAMPDMGVGEREARDIAAFLYTLR